MRKKNHNTFMARVHHAAFSPFPEKSSGNPVLISASRGADMSTSAFGGGDRGWSGSGFCSRRVWLGLGADGEGNPPLECSEKISISGSGITDISGSGIEAMVSRRESSAAVNSHPVLMSRFLQALDIFLLPLTPGELPTLG